MWGRSAQLWGHRRQDALTVSTMAWCPLLLTLVALCTGDWMGGQGKGPRKIQQPRVSKEREGPRPHTRVTVSLSPEAQGLRWEVWMRSPMRPPFCSSPLLHREWVLLSASSLAPHNAHGSGRVDSATFSDYILGQMATLTCAGNINHAVSVGTAWLQPHPCIFLGVSSKRSSKSS